MPSFLFKVGDIFDGSEKNKNTSTNPRQKKISNGPSPLMRNVFLLAVAQNAGREKSPSEKKEIYLRALF